MTNSESSFNSSSITSSSSNSSSCDHSINLKYLPSPRLLKRYRYSVLPSVIEVKSFNFKTNEIFFFIIKK
jgi:hypothetical protein